MKKISIIITFLIIGLCSCSKEHIEPIESYSSDQKMKISLSATRTSALDPWMLDIGLLYNETTSNVFQEFYADEVSKKNISFDWKSNRKCNILLTQRDGTIISIPIVIHD